MITAPLPSGQPTTTQPPRLVHCICGWCNPDVTSQPLTRPTAALCGHVVSVGAEESDGVHCLVCDDLELTHQCQESR